MFAISALVASALGTMQRLMNIAHEVDQQDQRLAPFGVAGCSSQLGRELIDFRDNASSAGTILRDRVFGFGQRDIDKVPGAGVLGEWANQVAAELVFWLLMIGPRIADGVGAAADIGQRIFAIEQ